MDEIAFDTATSLAARLRAGEFTAEELAQHHLHAEADSGPDHGHLPAEGEARRQEREHEQPDSGDDGAVPLHLPEPEVRPEEHRHRPSHRYRPGHRRLPPHPGRHQPPLLRRHRSRPKLSLIHN